MSEIPIKHCTLYNKMIYFFTQKLKANLITAEVPTRLVSKSLGVTRSEVMFNVFIARVNINKKCAIPRKWLSELKIILLV